MEENEKLEYANLIINELIKKKNNISYKEIKELFNYTICCLEEKLTLQNERENNMDELIKEVKELKEINQKILDILVFKNSRNRANLNEKN